MQTILKDAMFPKFEDQFYAQVSCTLLFPLVSILNRFFVAVGAGVVCLQEASLIYFPRDHAPGTGGPHGDMHRVVMIFPAAAVPRVAKRLHEVLGDETVDGAGAAGDDAGAEADD